MTLMKEFIRLAENIKSWGISLGFQQVGITDVDLKLAETRLIEWLKKGYHGTMHYMEKHGTKRTRPHELVPETLRVISVRMNYLSLRPSPLKTSQDPNRAYIARYALGRDYHKVVRKRLSKLAARIQETAQSLGSYRVFVDSAPILEKALAEKAGLGWIGKHTNLIHPKEGSWFFLGEIFVDIPLPIDKPSTSQCGRCQACLRVCPTCAIIAPYQLDARCCISYLTIENKGPISLELRPLIGNRIFGCDDCQWVCPWNRYAQMTTEPDFFPRQEIASSTLLDLFLWSESDFMKYTEGSALRRVGFLGWLRNIAVALGNEPYSPLIIKALRQCQHDSPLVREHVTWALQQQIAKMAKKDPLCIY